MKLGYQQATISFCMDLSSPDGASLPVANLLVGEAEDGRVVAGVALIVPDHLDPISKAVLADMHQLVRKYVDEAFQQRAPRAPLSEVLTRVYHSLRNTMHVSAIAEAVTREIDLTGPLSSAVISLVHDGLRQALTDAGFTLEHTRATPLARAAPLPSITNLDMPESYLWAPPDNAADRLAHAG